MHSSQRLIVGEEGQHRIEQSTVAIVGLGALGSVAAELLVRAGVHSLILIDRDIVEESNLQRQVLYAANDVGRSKALAAKERLEQISPGCSIAALPIHLNAKNIVEIEKADLILDCTDNLYTRFVLNDSCRKYGKKWIYAAAIKTAGYVMPIFPESACLRCFLQDAQLETCETAGVLNTITTSIAALQAQLALELLSGKDVKPVLYHYDLERKSFSALKIVRNGRCGTCQGNFVYLKPKEESRIVQFCGSGRYQIEGKKKDLALLKQLWEKIDYVSEDTVFVQFKNILLFNDGRALIKADSEEEALASYAKWVGS